MRGDRGAMSAYICISASTAEESCARPIPMPDLKRNFLIAVAPHRRKRRSANSKLFNALLLNTTGRSHSKVLDLDQTAALSLFVVEQSLAPPHV
jgi:hypothetical protein